MTYAGLTLAHKGIILYKLMHLRSCHGKAQGRNQRVEAKRL